MTADGVVQRRWPIRQDQQQWLDSPVLSAKYSYPDDLEWFVPATCDVLRL